MGTENQVEVAVEEMKPVRISIYNTSAKAFQDVSLTEAKEMLNTFLENLPALEKAIAEGEKEQANRDSYNNFLKTQSNGN
jgi:hypothetical protein